VNAGPVSTAYGIEGHDMRLVRTGDQELALQFELFNGTAAPVDVSGLGLDPREQLVGLVDLPRGTAYGLIGASGTNGRIGSGDEDTVAPGKTVTVTAMFAAPPQEADSMLVVVNGLLPVQVPIQPQGSKALRPDPVLTGSHDRRPVNPLACSTTGGSSEASLSGSGLQWNVAGVRRTGRYALAQVTVDNPTSGALPLDFQNHFTPKQVTAGQLTLGTGAGRRQACGFTDPVYYSFIGNLGQNFAPGPLGSVPAGAKITLWGLFAAPEGDTVNVGVGGFGGPRPAQVTPGD